MKKIYAFLAATLMSISVFAAPEEVPTKSNLTDAGYNPDANVVLCLYFDDAPCNPVVLAGDYAETDNWSLDPEKAKVFKPLAGFDGWYAVEFPWKEGVMAKPVQLKENADDTYDTNCWDFQSGDPDAWVPMDGSQLATIESENGNESKVSYPNAGAYIYELKYWKAHKSPCVFIPKFNYTIYLFDPECESNDFAPAIIGDFDSWSGTPMSKTTYEGDEAYMYVITDEADHKIKFREASSKDWSNQLQYKDENGNWKDFNDYLLPAVVNGTDTTLVFDYYDPEQYRYPLCGISYFDVEITAILPAGAPEAGVELMGSFPDGVWDGEGLLMEIDAETGAYKATIKANETSEFKFREKGNWGNQLEQFDGAEWGIAGNFKVGEEWEDEGGKKVINLVLNDASEWRWVSSAQGIENIKLTEDAHKVVVDGVLYIVRDNKLFNVQGAQVR